MFQYFYDLDKFVSEDEINEGHETGTPYSKLFLWIFLSRDDNNPRRVN